LVKVAIVISPLHSRKTNRWSQWGYIAIVKCIHTVHVANSPLEVRIAEEYVKSKSC
jgi:hypothetical protein